MTRISAGLWACVAAVQVMAAADARAQEGRAVCPANHLAVYNPDSYRTDCIALLRGGDKRTQALLDQQRRREAQLRREQFGRGYATQQTTEMLRGEQQWRTQKQMRASR